jgi:NAD-dependent dihydropyrimidine dehydrogenase PreA subunit
VPVVDEKTCILCGECETTCIYNVFKVDKKSKRVSIDEDKCWSCGFCVGTCPSQAIELRHRANKEKVIWNNNGLAEPFRIH